MAACIHKWVHLANWFDVHITLAVMAHKRPPRRFKYKFRTVVAALAGLVLFFLPVLALIPFWLLVDGFIPSIKLRQAAGLFAVFTGVAFLALLWSTQVQET